jgi:glyoxylase-like metal-dependent hydrolase (beta-lactamase superfamily II)
MKRAILALAISIAAGAWAQDKDVVREIGPGVSLIPGQFTRGRQPDGNSVVLFGNEGTIIIDTGRHRDHARRVLNVATRNGKKPVAVINTHWHLDHTGGNVVVRQAFPKATVYASGALANARKGFLADYRKQLAEAIATIPPRNPPACARRWRSSTRATSSRPTR